MDVPLDLIITSPLSRAISTAKLAWEHKWGKGELQVDLYFVSYVNFLIVLFSLLLWFVIGVSSCSCSRIIT